MSGWSVTTWQYVRPVTLFPGEPMKWVWLFSSILCEVIGTVFLKLSSDGGKHTYWYGAGVVLCYLSCFTLLAFAMKHFSVSTVYATWSGMGICLLALIGVLFFGDNINWLKIVSFVLVIAGVVGLNLSGMTH